MKIIKSQKHLPQNHQYSIRFIDGFEPGGAQEVIFSEKAAF